MINPTKDSLEFTCVSAVISNFNWEDTQKMMITLYNNNMRHFMLYLKEQLRSKYLKEKLRSKTTDAIVLAWIDDLSVIHASLKRSESHITYEILFDRFSSPYSSNVLAKVRSDNVLSAKIDWSYDDEPGGDNRSATIESLFSFSMIMDVVTLYESCFVYPHMKNAVMHSSIYMLNEFNSPYIDGTFPRSLFTKNKKQKL